MKTIIRIEHDCGNGLFKAKDPDLVPLLNKMSCNKPLCSRHSRFNTPWADGLDIEIDEFCAFKSIEQIQQWIIPKWFNEIIANGFRIWMIDVSDYKEGEFQILFRKDNIISKKDITQLFINKKTMKDKQLQDIIDDVKDLTDLMDWN